MPPEVASQSRDCRIPETLMTPEGVICPCPSGANNTPLMHRCQFPCKNSTLLPSKGLHRHRDDRRTCRVDGCPPRGRGELLHYFGLLFTRYSPGRERFPHFPCVCVAKKMFAFLDKVRRPPSPLLTAHVIFRSSA